VKAIIQNIATEYQDEGTGPVILMLHGWKTGLHSFDSIATILGKNFRVVRLDLPGFGQTENPPASWDLDCYVSFAADFIAKLELKNFYLIGHSFGGRIIIKGAATGKFNPKKVVLIASAGIAKTNTLRSQSFRAIAKIGKAVASVPPISFAKDALRKKLYRAAGSDYLAAGALKESYLNVIVEDLSQVARGVDVPTLLVWGSDDAETPVSDGELLAREIPHARLEILPSSGHFVFQENPVKVASLIGEFFA
jgi:pimeloyl-ACP methyl ester carboxylesterase